MLLTAKAWQLREAARRALAAGQIESAIGLATEAQNAHHTRAGECLRVLSKWLSS